MKISRSDEPAYAGIQTFMKVPLALETEDLEGADVAIVGAPMDEMVTHRPGTRFGPREIRQATDAGNRIWHMDLGVNPFTELNVVDYGDAECIPADPYASHKAIRAAVDAISKAGAAPMVLGGDHSISFPIIAAVAQRHDDIAVVHFDTHADTAEENWDVKYAHGTPFRRLVESGAVAGNKLVQIGLRGGWPWEDEWTWMRSAGVRWHRMEQVMEAGIDSVMSSVLYEIGSAKNVYISVDIDVLDPAYAPGTGTPEPGGLTTWQLLRAVRAVVLEKGLVGMDVVEVSPPYDHAQITAMAANRVVLEALSALALWKRGRSPSPEDP
jgi:agmatinase